MSDPMPGCGALPSGWRCERSAGSGSGHWCAAIWFETTPPESPLDVAGAVRRLPTSQRAAIVLHYYEDRPVAEIASILGCAEATARVHLHRGRKRLAELLGEDDDVA